MGTIRRFQVDNEGPIFSVVKMVKRLSIMLRTCSSLLGRRTHLSPLPADLNAVVYDTRLCIKKDDYSR